jgi:hypothetical protein
MTSPPSCSASHAASVDLPDAVGPTMATSGKVEFCWLIEKSSGVRERKEK